MRIPNAIRNLYWRFDLYRYLGWLAPADSPARQHYNIAKTLRAAGADKSKWIDHPDGLLHSYSYGVGYRSGMTEGARRQEAFLCAVGELQD